MGSEMCIRDRNEDAPSKPSILSTVIGRWLADPAFAEADGARVPLPRQAEDGPSFDRLVEAITSDVRPRTLLDELVRKGAVTVDAETDMITLTNSALIGSSGLDDGLYFLERNVGDHIAAAVENLLAEKPPFMERAVFYNKLTPDSVNRIEAHSREQAMALLMDVNRLAASCQKADDGKQEATERLRLGVFFYRADEDGSLPPGSST